MVATQSMSITAVETKEYFHKKFDEIKDNLVSKEKSFINNQAQNIEKLESTVSVLQIHVEALKSSNEKLLHKSNDNEQYGRRLCLRIDGVPVADGNKKKDDVLNIVREVRRILCDHENFCYHKFKYKRLS